MAPGEDVVAPAERRRRNPRGQGARLRDEILIGAAAILERTGSEASISLRAVAREIGITAPSITPHFADAAEIIDAVVAGELASLRDTVGAAIEAAGDPPGALLAACRAYLAHGRANPNRYRVIFERRYLPVWDEQQRTMAVTAPLMAETFDMVVTVVQACVDTGRSASGDVFADTVALWCFLHGLVALPPTIPSFPWPDIDRLLTTSVGDLAHLT
jgi:AcrR family transcriptional regulator